MVETVHANYTPQEIKRRSPEDNIIHNFSHRQKDQSENFVFHVATLLHGDDLAISVLLNHVLKLQMQLTQSPLMMRSNRKYHQMHSTFRHLVAKNLQDPAPINYQTHTTKRTRSSTRLIASQVEQRTQREREREREREVGRRESQTGSQSGRQTDRQTDRQADRVRRGGVIDIQRIQGQPN